MVYGAVQDAPCQGFTDSISCVAFRENTQQNAPEFLVGGSWDKTVRMYQVNPSAQTPQIQPGPTQTLHKAPVLCCTWGAANSPYADYVFSGACDNTFGMWNYKQNKTNIVNAHQSPVSCIRFVALNNGSQPALATAGWDKYLKYWDVRAPPTQPASFFPLQKSSGFNDRSWGPSLASDPSRESGQFKKFSARKSMGLGISEIRRHMITIGNTI